jgi:tetratricopeptide (TPR) repeat protein
MVFFSIVLAFMIFSQGAHGQIAVAAEPALEDESSIYLVTKAWDALKNNDLEAVKALTRKCIDRYGLRALEMQKQLQGFTEGSDAQVRRYWALNDVATALFIQGKAYQAAGMYEEAIASYTQLVHEYKFGQCWDPKGWFWKPAQVAQENIAMIKRGVFFDYGDYASATLVSRAWEAGRRSPSIS